MPKKTLEKRANVLSTLGITPWVLRANKQIPLHLLSFLSEIRDEVKICVIQIQSERDASVLRKQKTILQNAMSSINFEVRAENVISSSVEACDFDLADQLQIINPSVLLVTDHLIVRHLNTKNLRKAEIGEICVLDKLEIPVIEIPSPGILLEDFREKKYLWSRLLEIQTFLSKASP
jgi:hypothetical protein